MESPKHPNYSKEQRLVKIIRMIETIIKRGVNPQFKIAVPEHYIVSAECGLDNFQKQCYPIGFSDERIVDYLTYQIYRNRETVGRGRWSVTWLFTQNAIDKYKAQFLTKTGKSGMRYYINEWLDDIDLSSADLLDMILPPKPNGMRQYIYMPSEEPIKRRWLNQEIGFLLCQHSTTGWSPQSPTCQICKHAVKCEKQTKQNYPELIRLRKEI